MPASANCALDGHGNLKDAKDIVWYDSGGDDMPRPPAVGKSKPKPRVRAVKSLEALGAEVPRGQRRVIKLSRKARAAAGILSGEDEPRSEAEENVQVGQKRQKIANNKVHASAILEVPQKKRTKKAVVDSDDESGEEGTCNPERGDEVDAYEHLREQRETDRPVKKPHASRGNDSRTADIRTLFTAETRTMPDGTTEKGHWCEVCKCHGEAKHWLTGGVSTLRKHINRRWKTHGNTYRNKCKEQGIKMYPGVEPEAPPELDDRSQLRDGNIASFMQPKPVKWTKEGLLEHIIELVAFAIVDKGSFRRILKYQRPQTLESDIPHRTKLREEIICKAGEAKEHIAEELKSLPGQISITFDAWTSDASDPYLAVTAHYIHSEVAKPNDWELRSKLLGYTKIQGNHSGANTAAVILSILDRYGIRHKLGWATSDNATTNDRAMCVLQCVLDDPSGRRWIATQRRGRCMEHTISLASKAFIEAICPTPAHYKRQKAKTTASDSVDSDGGLSDDDNELAWLATLANDTLISSNTEVDEDMDFDAGDLLGKVLALINQIRASPQAKVFFATMCQEEGLTPLELIKWIRIRWGSMYDLINRVLVNRAAVDKFCLLADASPKVPSLQKKKYVNFSIVLGEWVLLSLIHDILQETRDAQSTFSSETISTVWRTIPTLECLIKNWEMLEAMPKFAPVRHGIVEGLAKLRKYSMATDQTDIFFICLALEPSIKLEYTKQNWSSEDYEKGLASFQKVFDDYYSPSTSLITPTTASMAVPPAKPKGFGMSFIQAAVRGRIEKERASRNSRQEILDYINSPLEIGEFDPVKWWGHHQTQFPTLARIARDYLAIQGSSVSSERAFSSGGLTDTKARNQLKPEAFEALQILKSCYKDGLFIAEDEAAAHDHMWVPMDVDDDG